MSQPDVSPDAWAGVHRGPLRAGEWVRLVDAKGRRHNFCLEPGKRFFSNRGHLEHDDLIDREEGFTVTSSLGGEYLVFRPLLSEFVVSMPRGAAVVYPKDSAQIVAMADVFPGAHVVEAGVGSGALTCSLLRAVGPHGRVLSYERREEFADVARRNVTQFFGGDHPAWELRLGDLAEELPASGERTDRLILDMLAPWDCLDAAADRAAPGRHPVRVRRHHDAAVPHRRGHARARRLHRAAGLGVAGPRLARRGARGAAGPRDDRPHGVPGHGPPDGAGGAPAAQAPPARAGRLRSRLHRAATTRRTRRALTSARRVTRTGHTRWSQMYQFVSNTLLFTLARPR